MPRKLFELTLEIHIDAVSCPGVWLCQDGNVSLTIFTLGSTYQTWRHVPIFPLNYNETFVFKKRFNKIRALTEVNSLLDDETFYCELVQWSPKYADGKVLAQYLGQLGEMLFLPSMCASDGIDLLMKTTKHFTGIIAPKIELRSKMKVDQVFDRLIKSLDRCSGEPRKPSPPRSRKKSACHTQEFHGTEVNTRIKQKSSKSPRRRRAASPPFRDPRRSPSPTPLPVQQSSARNCTNQDTTIDTLPSDMSSVYLSDSETALDVPTHDRDTLLAKNEASFSSCKINISTLSSKAIDSAIGQIPLLRRQHGLAKVEPATVNFEPCSCHICQRYHEVFHGDMLQG